ncbi:hypothetical protein ONA23_04825 [Mycoplasmopsis cynos]|uniref:hypothetical protein n=1 Tax=Mycoplasmopsis cynos TaxID=171284 RepID=UPI0024C9AE43|nr:hypothetical protein [Mycoplasmopsis cynos]WAM06302.1 hypothetical protein ONA23_04825 [Mycoplasmopsis cynos]
MEKRTKYIIQTGGVLSGLGKGVTLASIGNLLKSQGFNVFVMKLDPYLNIDPGVMSPTEHKRSLCNKRRRRNWFRFRRLWEIYWC